jgi:hypothetical protein
VGLGVLVLLLALQPLGDIAAAASRVGWSALGVLAFTPLWYVTNTTGLWLLLDRQVRWAPLFFNRIVGDGLNALLPLASVGGEPWKVQHLGRWVRPHVATTAVIADRLIEEVSGALFAGGCLVASGAALAWPAWLRIGGTALGVGLIAGGVAACLTLVGRTPARLAGWILRLLGGPTGAATTLDPRALAAALALHIAGRAAGALEVGFLLYAVGAPTGPDAVAGATGVLIAAGAAALVVPQGLGAFEAAAVLVLGMLGQPAAVGVAFGLLRRGRIVFYGALGGALGLWDARRAARSPEQGRAPG